MKAIRIAALASVCLVATSASAQEAQQAPPKNTITANPLGLALGAINFEYERATSQKMSWFIGPPYSTYTTSFTTDEFTASAYGLTGGVRFFLTGHAPEGFFISPNASVSYATASAFDETASSLSWSLGAIGG